MVGRRWRSEVFWNSRGGGTGRGGGGGQGLKSAVVAVGVIHKRFVIMTRANGVLLLQCEPRPRGEARGPPGVHVRGRLTLLSGIGKLRWEG